MKNLIPKAMADVISQPVGSEFLPGPPPGSADEIRDHIIFSKIIPFAISYAIALATSLCVIAMIWAGYLYLTAYGDTEKHEKAFKTATYAALGLTISLTAYGIIKIITNIQIS